MSSNKQHIGGTEKETARQRKTGRKTKEKIKGEINKERWKGRRRTKKV
jgi:hypothetical protein